MSKMRFSISWNRYNICPFYEIKFDLHYIIVEMDINFVKNTITLSGCNLLYIALWVLNNIKKMLIRFFDNKYD